MMPASQFQDPGPDPYAARQLVSQGGNVTDEQYKEWQQRQAAYKAAKDANVSRAYDGSPLTINPDNYQVASQGDYIDLARHYDEARARQGVQLQNQAADAALIQSAQARGYQQDAANLYGAAALGMTPSAAQQQMQMALEGQTQVGNRQAAQYGAARALSAGTGAYGQTLGQGAAGRQQETQQAYQGAAANLGNMRSGDIAAMRQSQDAAYAQAQLDAAQRARNDAMARAYLGQSNNLSIEQLGADQAYEAQKASNQLGVTDQMEKQRRLDAEQQAKVVGAVTSAFGTGLAAGARG